jgi:hypothetical protein
VKFSKEETYTFEFDRKEAKIVKGILNNTAFEHCPLAEQMWDVLSVAEIAENEQMNVSDA